MYLLIATHFGSGASMLCSSLSQHPYVGRMYTKGVYKHPTDLQKTTGKIHFDKVVLNHQIESRSILNICKFIYVIREARPSLLSIKGYTPANAVDYYCFRLRRLCEMAKKTGGLLLTFDDLASGHLELVQEFLGLGTPLVSYYQPEEITGDFPYPLIVKAQEKYEKYYLFLKQVTSQ